MDEDTIAGAGQRMAGKVEGAAGAVLGDTRTEARGQARKAAGELQQQYGEIKDAVRDFAVHQPFLALGAATVFGMLLGVHLSRR